MDGGTICLHAGGGGGGPRPLPRRGEARALFEPALPCEPPALRRAYLRLALQFHPDKHPESERAAATDLFQAIAAVYEELCAASSRDGAATRPLRVKSRVAAAAELGDLDELRRLLAERPEQASEPDDLGIIPLMFAASGGCIEAAEVLLSCGADVHARNPIGWSVLLYAALGNHGHMVDFLVSRGAEVSSNDLIITAFTGNPDGLRALVEGYRGLIADLRTDQSKKTLLHLAVDGMCFLKHSAERHAECVRIALQWKAPVDAREPRLGRTCLQDYVADVRWRTRAFENSKAHVEVLELLCTSGANVTAEDNSGQSALSLAADSDLSRAREVLFSFV